MLERVFLQKEHNCMLLQELGDFLWENYSLMVVQKLRNFLQEENSWMLEQDWRNLTEVVVKLYQILGQTLIISAWGMLENHQT